MIPVNNIFDPYDVSIIWYPISGFPGYEASIVNQQLYVRSLKMFRKYPFGDLIYPGNSNKYQLSNFNNQRVFVSIQEVLDNMDKSDPRSTYIVDTSKSRNKRMGIMCVESPKVGTIVKDPKPVRKKTESSKYFMPKFTIVDGGNNNEK